MKLQNRTAIVTGATKGIGRAIALAFAKEGADIAATGRNAEELASLEQEVTALGVRCATMQADLAEAGVVDKLYARFVEELGPIHILVNNAGMGSSANPKPVIHYDDDFWTTMLHVNLTVPYLLSKKVLPSMVEQQHGRIIQISSINGKLPSFHGAAYAASKHGLLGLMRTIAVEHAGDGITSNAICPGPVDTLVNRIRVEYDAERLGKTRQEMDDTATPLGRRLEAEEIAPMAVYLASDEAAVITGQAFNIDGGVLMAH